MSAQQCSVLANRPEGLSSSPEISEALFEALLERDGRGFLQLQTDAPESGAFLPRWQTRPLCNGVLPLLSALLSWQFESLI